jgi:hypothetical protein
MYIKNGLGKFNRLKTTAEIEFLNAIRPFKNQTYVWFSNGF